MTLGGGEARPHLRAFYRAPSRGPRRKRPIANAPAIAHAHAPMPWRSPRIYPFTEASVIMSAPEGSVHYALHGTHGLHGAACMRRPLFMPPQPRSKMRTAAQC